MSSKRATDEFKRRFRHIPEIIMNQGDVEIADVEIAEDYVEHIPMPPQFTTNRKGFKEFVLMLRTAFPDLHYDIDHLTKNDLIGDNQKVVHRITAHATHTGPWGPIPPTGKKMTWTEIHIGLYVQGMLVEHWGNIDSFGIMQQMGAIPGWIDRPELPPLPILSDEIPETSVPENVAMVHRYIRQVWNRGNFDVAEEMIHPEGLAPSQPMFPAGPQGAKLGAMMWRNAFDNLYILIEDTIAEDSMVAIRFKLLGRHKAEFMGVPPTGRDIEMDGCSIFNFGDGKIIQRWMEVDKLGLFTQLTMPG